MLFTNSKERESASGQCGSISFSFLAKTDYVMEKQAASFNSNFLSETSLSHYPLLGINKIKSQPLVFPCLYLFLFGAEMKVIENHIAQFSKI